MGGCEQHTEWDVTQRYLIAVEAKAHNAAGHSSVLNEGSDGDTSLWQRGQRVHLHFACTAQAVPHMIQPHSALRLSEMCVS